MKRGWWKFEITGMEREDLSDGTLEYVAQLILEGCIEGELLEEEQDNSEWDEINAGEERFESKRENDK